MKDFEQEMKEQYRELGNVLQTQEIVNNKTAKRYMKRRLNMFWFDWVLYVLVVLAIGVAIYETMKSPGNFWIAFLVAFLVVSMVSLFGLTPREVELTPEAVIIRLWIGKREIAYNQIRQVERFSYPGTNIRLFGTSGSKLRVGWFWNSEIKTYKAYVSDKYDTILLTLHSGKKVALSAPHSEEYVEAISQNMQG